MKFWRTLETLAKPAAVLAEWQVLTGDEHGRAQAFLRATERQSDTVPCTCSPGCGQRHEIEADDTGINLRAVSRNREVKCQPIPLQPHDMLVHELNTAKLCAAIRSALGFAATAPNGLNLSARSHPVGVHGAARSPVLLTMAHSESVLLREIEALLAVVAAPFILLTPTPTHCTVRVEGVLRRNGCVVIPLSTVLQLEDRGVFRLCGRIDGVLAAFDQRLATGPGLVKTVEEIHRDIATVAKQKRDLSEAKARLEQMHGEGVFAFARHIDREAREQFLAVMACGDVAKAARDLGMKDSTLRSRLEKWPQRGKAYAALAEIVRWRKSIKGEAGMDQAKRVASGAERDVDYPALVRDVIAELEELVPDNWEERCGDLAEALRKVVS